MNEQEFTQEELTWLDDNGLFWPEETKDGLKVGDIVQVHMPYAVPKSGWLEGKIYAIHKNHNWTGRDGYEVHGKGFVTIATKILIH